MGSNAGARILLVIGFLAAWIGYDAWIVSHVVLDPNTTRAAAHALLDAPSVRRGLADQVAKQIDAQLPGASQDPRVAKAITTAMRDPRVGAAFADTIARIHEAILSNGTGQTFVVDGRPLRAAVHDALAPSDPQIAAEVAHLAPLQVSIKPDKLPHVHDPRTAADGVAVLGIMAALLLITASLLQRHDRRAFATVGRRTAFLAVTPILVLVVFPRVLDHASGDAPQIASALLRVYGDRVLPSAIALLVAGITIIVGAVVWRSHARNGSSTPGSNDDGSRYTGPPPTPRPRVAPDQPTITEKMYL